MGVGKQEGQGDQLLAAIGAKTKFLGLLYRIAQIGDGVKEGDRVSARICAWSRIDE